MLSIQCLRGVTRPAKHIYIKQPTTTKGYFMSKRKTSVSSILNSSKKFVSNFWDKYDYSDEYSAHSNYWLKGSIFDKKTSMFAEPEEQGSKYDYHALAQYQRAITNFVHILTADPTIKVQYNSAGNNSTDGKTINLSATMKEEDFDANVGLALHESSHILYTDFTKSITEFQYPNVDKILPDETASKLRENDGETKQTILGRTFGWEGYKQNFKTILNIVEDLYIDAMTYSNAPGYRAYYKSLYHKYFGDDKISRGFWQPDMCQPTMDNYMFHLCNFRSPARNLKALPELETIWNLIDMRNIRRLSEQQDRIDLAYKVYSTIIGQIADYKVDDSQSDNDGESDGEQGDFGGNDGIGDSQSDGNIGTNSKWTPPTPDADQNIKPLSDKQIEQLRKLVEKQKDFINGQLNKSKLSKQDASKVDAFASVDMNQNNVAKGFEDDCGRVHANGIKVYTIKRLTEKFMQSDVSAPFGVYAHYSTWRTQQNAKEIEKAISLGKLLAKRLQIRNEERVDKSTRLRSGKIDKRLLHEIGFDNYEIFNKISINKYKDSYIHLSIDASGSMQGDKFNESVKLAAMFATASKLIRNLRVVVTARSTINQNYYGYSNNKSKSDMNETPYMVYLFDSKQDGIADIRRIFPRLYSTNTTPEGLTFEAIMNDIYKESTNTDAFFINLCDGQPYMSKEITRGLNFRYNGRPAQDHSRRQVDRMRSHGINVMTYFIGSKRDFQDVLDCYKTNCHHLANSEELNKVVQSMNSELLSSSRKTHG
jgi:hypothetical protein